MRQEHKMTLDMFDSRCLKNIRNVRWYDFISNTHIREWTKQGVGLVARMGSGQIVRRIQEWLPPGKRRRRRPLKTWKDTLQQDLGCTCQTLHSQAIGTSYSVFEVQCEISHNSEAEDLVYRCSKCHWSHKTCCITGLTKGSHTVRPKTAPVPHKLL